MLLKVESLCFGYGERQPVLKNIAFTLSKGCLLGISGPNGIGKSTLLKCLNGIYQPREGNIYLEEQRLTTYTPKEIARKVSYVPQYTSAFFPIDVFHTVLMGRIPYCGYRFTETDYRAVENVLNILDLSSYAKRDIRSLSGGERQRVFVARAMIGKPAMILMDEPTSSLDIKHTLELMKLIRSFVRHRHVSVIMTVHDLNIASIFCDQVMLIKSGSVYEIGEPEDVLTTVNIEAIYGIQTFTFKKMGSAIFSQWSKYVLAILVILFLIGEEGIAGERQSTTLREAEYPVSVENYTTEHKPVILTFYRSPKRIIAYHQNHIEMMKYLQEEDRIIAALGRYVSMDKKETTEKAALLERVPYYGFFGINQEMALYLQPDLILGWPSSFAGRGVWSLGTTGFWEKRDVNCYMSGAWSNGQLRESIQDECDYIRNMGIIFDKQKEAQAAINEIHSYIENMANLRQNGKPRVLILDYFNSIVTSYGKERLPGDMVSCLGGELIDLSSRPSKEDILMSDPDVVFLVIKDESEQTIRDWFLDERLYDSMKVVHTGRVYTIPITYVYNPGLRVKDGLMLMKNALYPEGI